jgi:hypothetical protein
MANNILEANRIKYLDLTHKLNDYNEIYSVNNYLQEANSVELDRLRSTDNTIKTRVLRLKQEYLQGDHGIKEYKFRTNILYFSAIVISFLLLIGSLFIQGRINQKIAIIISVTLIVVYLLILLFVVKANVERRSYAYDQYYWDQVKKQI